MMIKRIREELPINEVVVSGFMLHRNVLVWREIVSAVCLVWHKLSLHHRKKTECMDHKQSDYFIHYAHLFTHPSEVSSGRIGARSLKMALTRVFHDIHNHSVRKSSAFPY